MKDKLKVLSVPTTTALVHNLSSIHGKREIEGGREGERGCLRHLPLTLRPPLYITHLSYLPITDPSDIT